MLSGQEWGSLACQSILPDFIPLTLIRAFERETLVNLEPQVSGSQAFVCSNTFPVSGLSLQHVTVMVSDCLQLVIGLVLDHP